MHSIISVNFPVKSINDEKIVFILISEFNNKKNVKNYYTSFQQQRIPRGKGLGGSGQLNYLVHSFGRPEDYSKWPRGWSYADLQPYFKKVASTMHVQQIANDDQGLVQALNLARETMNETDTVFMGAQITLFEGSRWSTYQSHLQRAWNRRNLHIVVNTMVTRVSLNSKKDTIEFKFNIR